LQRIAREDKTYFQKKDGKWASKTSRMEAEPTETKPIKQA